MPYFHKFCLHVKTSPLASIQNRTYRPTLKIIMVWFSITYLKQDFVFCRLFDLFLLMDLQFVWIQIPFPCSDCAKCILHCKARKFFHKCCKQQLAGKGIPHCLRTPRANYHCPTAKKSCCGLPNSTVEFLPPFSGWPWQRRHKAAWHTASVWAVWRTGPREHQQTHRVHLHKYSWGHWSVVKKLSNKAYVIVPNTSYSAACTWTCGWEPGKFLSRRAFAPSWSKCWHCNMHCNLNVAGPELSCKRH